jgi:glycosyltransferase involved in cell wall biosynthesis
VTEVLIDATALGDDSAYRGIGTYVRHLVSALAADEGLSLAALVRAGTAMPPGVQSVVVRRSAPGRFRRVEQDLRLPIDLRRHRAGVFHGPALNPPRRIEGPWVQTLHDLIPLVYDDAELAVERRWLRRQIRRYRAADAVIAVSRYTAQQGIALLGLDPRRVEVIPHGVDSAFRPGPERRDAEPPSLLMVGEYSKRKGYAEAFAAIGALADRGYPHVLRTSGRIAPWVAPITDALRAQASHPERIELLGFVDDLVGEYQRASVVIVPSRYEGFGLPVLEAMACGTPVVAFANSSVTEVVGDAGVLVTDGDVAGLVAAISSLLDDPERWSELEARGRERAATFTWERSAAAHAELYRVVAR